MAGPAKQQKPSFFSSANDWIAERSREAARSAHELEAAGRKAWNEATRTGQNVQAATTAQLRALGAQVLAGEQAAKQAVARTVAATKKTSAQLGQGLAKTTKEISPVLWDNGRAFGSGLVDAITFDLADPAGSVGGAAWDKLHGKSFADSYKARMAAKAAQDTYDREHYGIARGVGEVGGTALALLGAAPLEGWALSARIAETTPLILREYAALTGAGAAAGVGGQVISDVGRGRPGSPGDYAGAAVGGAVGGALAPGGRAVVSGAAMGAATSLAQDAFNGRLDSGWFDRTMSGARVGGAFGAVGGRFGRQEAQALPGQIKGPAVEQTSKELLGEDFSKLRTWARGEKTIPMKKKTRQVVSGGHTKPDQRTMLNGVEKDLVESKFGKSARLKKRQREAYAELPNYRVDHTLPQDVGVLQGVPLSLLGLDLDRVRRDW